jgi:hypothetical protein
MKLTYVALVLSALSQPIFAQDAGMSSPYAFGGSCSSQGVWTQNALTATQSLRKITLQLKDDPNCKALGNNLQAALSSLEENMKNLEDNMKTPEGTSQKPARISQIPQELNALRTFATGTPEVQRQVLKLMMDRSIEGATLSASVAGAGETANMLLDFGARVNRSTKTGIVLLNQVVDSLPLMNQCLVGDGGQALGQYVGMAVKIAASFSSSGQDLTGSQLATTVSKLTNLMREAKFSKILRKLNQQEFTASLACLTELTSESYCQARDAMGLFTKAMEDIKMRQTTLGENSATNPFLGYYILNTHVPNITKWLQKIQVGVDPKLPTDAVFQNKIQQDVTDFYKSVKTLLGDYNTQAITIKALPTLEAKQNATMNLLIQISNKMTGNTGYVSPNANDTNFFTMSKIAQKVPFFLVGMDTVPDQVAGRAMPLLTFDQWFQANLSNLPMFKDPVALLDTIRENMNTLIHNANISAIQYFNKWYIVDKAALVTESMVDINYTVKDSLKAIQSYLNFAKDRINKYGGDASTISIITDTQSRIQKILDAYADVEALGKSMAQSKDINLTEAQTQKISEVYEKLVNIVYEQFIVMQARSGFLANRLVSFVYNDYILLVKNKVDFTPYQQALFYSQGMAAFDRMLQIYNGNPANIKTDLNMALRINGGNLEALEMLLKDSMVATISQLRLVADGKASSEGAVVGDSLRRLRQDMLMQNLNDARGSKKSLWKFINLFPTFQNMLNFSPASLMYWFKHIDRYPMASGSSEFSAPQSEFNDAAALHAQLCIQALAFNDQTGISGICAGSLLKSPITGAKGYDVSYDQKLSMHMRDKGVTPQMRASLNRSERVCAFRTYNLQNMVLFMGITKGK